MLIDAAIERLGAANPFEAELLRFVADVRETRGSRATQPP
jgi:hypothetical protein